MLKQIRKIGTSTGPALIVLFVTFLFWTSQALAAELSKQESEEPCRQVLALLGSQQNELQQELRLVKRELALLKDTMGRPGITEIIGGIGYIIGIFGVGCYLHARNLIKAKR
jgi:hypothetical protein